MIGDITQVALGGIVALLILREVFAYLAKRKPNGEAGGKTRPNTDRVKNVQNGVDAVLSRLDRIIERLEDVTEQTKAARKQTEITGERTERITRQLEKIEETLTEVEAATRRRATGPQPTP